ncbi:hypothetical protein QBC37DRAFT_450509 [Rhypophila decipiens]|uniref:Galactose oxidase-like Early set domain-containing protein n=1 Tax=Rhypophila decipiens TaxID=261697 RepID=A0AAN7B612_9PEZI|nr:hypothetical protein QBC37DRAFT_450509 [Rhypophila decipiens]
MAAQVGQWSVPIDFNNVPVHLSLLPTGKILYFGRRDDPKVPVNGTMDQQYTRAFVWEPEQFSWDPAMKMSRAKPNDDKPGRSQPTANQPMNSQNKETVNLFCSGHCFLPDGNLLIVGGHFRDGLGIDQACTYNPWTNKFTPHTPMNGGRWYPSALTLPDGKVMVMSGSVKDNAPYQPNNVSQIWTSDPAKPWEEAISALTAGGPQALALYPRIHLTPTGRVFMCGPNPQSWFLDVKDANGADIKTRIQDGPNVREVTGRWVDAKAPRPGGFRDYTPSVMYNKGLLMYIGGGQDGQRPSNEVAFINLNDNQPQWSQGPNMAKFRRQFNATILPDGTVFVNGGTQGPGFNDLDEFAIHQSELFDPYEKDPATGKLGRWSNMAPETFDRCYHGTSLLLPDGRVLSAGGGEWPGGRPQDCLTLAQFFEPPYLHKPDPRPLITAVPPYTITYSQNFTITLGAADPPVKQVSWIRLGSVTHCRNMNQSFLWLDTFKQSGTSLTIKAPDSPNVSPPGHYMLFVLSAKRIPSIGKIIQILPAIGNKPKRLAGPSGPSQEPTEVTAPTPNIQPSPDQANAHLTALKGYPPPVTIGITPLCPYGLGPCWAGAYEGLSNISDIEVVCPVSNQSDATASVYLTSDITLPDIEKWREEFSRTVNASYKMRGIELTLSGVVAKTGDKLVLVETGREELTLGPFTKESQVRWDNERSAPKGVTKEEMGAYTRLDAEMKKHSGGKFQVQATGTLQKQAAMDGGKFLLEVREFKVLG